MWANCLKAMSEVKSVFSSTNAKRSLCFGIKYFNPPSQTMKYLF